VDGTLAGNTEAPITSCSCSTRALTCGANPGSPVTDDYASLFNLTGAIQRVTVDVSAELIRDGEAEPRVHMARQQATGGALPRNTPDWSIWTPTAAPTIAEPPSKNRPDSLPER
jgi:hypothetical protein